VIQGLFYLSVIVYGSLGAVAGGIVGGLGMRRLNSPWQTEREAQSHYQSRFPSRPPAPPPAVRSMPIGSAGMSLRVPLLMGRF
jgi:hypothetical protein